MTAAPRLRVEGARRSFGATRAVDDVSLSVGAGEFVTLLGDSGCGKTTLLRIVAGFVAPDSGRVLRDGADITRLSPAARRMGFVFQSYALFPTKTVAGNIGFAPRIAGGSAADVRRRVEELAAIMELDALLHRYPHELSGGQQQRVALARALAGRPDILLLDEPLSALDARIRSKLRGEIRAIVDRFGVTALYVTHDQEEALALSDRVAVMQAGRIEQIGTPDEIYHRPASRFVAAFVGVANIIAGHAADGGVLAGGRCWPVAAPLPLPLGAAVHLVLRPEHLAPSDAGDLAGQVIGVSFLGPMVRLAVDLGEATVTVDCASAGHRWRVGAPSRLAIDRSAAVVLADKAA